MENGAIANCFVVLVETMNGAKPFTQPHIRTSLLFTFISNAMIVASQDFTHASFDRPQ